MSRRVSSDAQIWTEVLESDDLHPGDLDRPLLKNIACQKLGVVAKVDEIASPERTPGHMKRTNPKVFTGVSCMPGEYEIKLREGVTPFLFLETVIKSIEDNGVTLNIEKCKFAKKKIRFLGHLISENGIQADPSKVEAITQMEAPTNS